MVCLNSKSRFWILYITKEISLFFAKCDFVLKTSWMFWFWLFTFSKVSRNLSVGKWRSKKKKEIFRKEKVKFHIYPQIPPKTNTHILDAHELVNTQVTSKFVRFFLIKWYKTKKSPFLLLCFQHFWKKKFTLLDKSSNCERLVDIW